MPAGNGVAGGEFIDAVKDVLKVARGKRSRKLSPAGRKTARQVRRVIGRIAKSTLQARHDVRHVESARFFRRGGHQAGKGFAGSGDFHRLVFFNPGGDAGKPVSPIPDGCCFHRETNRSHRLTDVNSVQGCRNRNRGQRFQQIDPADVLTVLQTVVDVKVRQGLNLAVLPPRPAVSNWRVNFSDPVPCLVDRSPCSAVPRASFLRLRQRSG